MLKPSVRGNWLRNAIGQIWRHRPGITTKLSGSSGISNPQISRRPIVGLVARK